MTLIATLQTQGYPYAVGDLLISTKDGTPAGVRRKVHILRDNLTASWTGAQIAAGMVLEKLGSCLPPAPSMGDLLANLRTFTAADFGSLPLILQFALVNQDSSFTISRWNCQWPHELFDADYLYDGSASGYAEALTRRFQTTEVTFATVEERMRALLFDVVWTIALFMADDATDRQARDAAAGIGYEGAYYNGERFVYFEDCAFVLTSAQFDDSDKCTFSAVPTYMRVSHIGAFTVVRRIDLTEFGVFIASDVHSQPDVVTGSRLLKDMTDMTQWATRASDTVIVMRVEGPRLKHREIVPHHFPGGTNDELPFKISLIPSSTIAHRLRIEVRDDVALMSYLAAAESFHKGHFDPHGG